MVGNISTAIESITLFETFEPAWKIDDSVKTLAVPAEKYKPPLKPPAIRPNVTKNQINVLEINFFSQSSYLAAIFF